MTEIYLLKHVNPFLCTQKDLSDSSYNTKFQAGPEKRPTWGICHSLSSPFPAKVSLYAPHPLFSVLMLGFILLCLLAATICRLATSSSPSLSDAVIAPAFFLSQHQVDLTTLSTQKGSPRLPQPQLGLPQQRTQK